MITQEEITCAQLDDFKGGWFVGDFEPSLEKNSNFEVSVKFYKKGDFEKRHVHKIAKEYTIITQGLVEMDGKCYKVGDIVIVPPGVSTDFRALEDCATTVVKVPSVSNDKFYTD